MKLSPGKLLYRLFYQPTLKYRYNLTHFGLRGWFKMHQGEKAMKKAALNLSPVNLTNDYILEVSYLTGKNYWHQTIFCAYSLAMQVDGRLKVNIFSDGTLSGAQCNAIKRALNNVYIVDQNEISEQLKAKLPEHAFPTLNYLRKNNPFFRKLVDMRLNADYIIQLDSDMLFFNRPHKLIDDFKTEDFSFMQDMIESSYYVLPEKQISAELGITVKEKINSGILAYDSSKIDWPFVEKTCKYLLSKIESISPPMLEQTINAIIISILEGTPLDNAYKILYDDGDEKKMETTDIVRHYIYKAKYVYLTAEWKKLTR